MGLNKIWKPFGFLYQANLCVTKPNFLNYASKQIISTTIFISYERALKEEFKNVKILAH